MQRIIPQPENIHWQISAGHIVFEPPKDQPGYSHGEFETELDTPTRKARNTKPAPRRAQSVIDAENDEILRLLKEGLAGKEIYDTMLESGFFVNKIGRPMNIRTAYSRTSKIRSKQWA